MKKTKKGKIYNEFNLRFIILSKSIVKFHCIEIIWSDNKYNEPWQKKKILLEA